METRTIREIRVNDLPNGETYFVYVFRAGFDVLYVGESLDINKRVLRHIRGVGGSYLSKAIRKTNYRIYDSWLVDFYSAKDILEHPWVKQRRYFLRDLDDNQLNNIFRKKFEKHLIYTLSPAFNAKCRKGDYKLACRNARTYYPSISEEEIYKLGRKKINEEQLSLPFLD